MRPYRVPLDGSAGHHGVMMVCIFFLAGVDVHRAGQGEVRWGRGEKVLRLGYVNVVTASRYPSPG